MIICASAARGDAIHPSDMALGGVREAAEGGCCAHVPEENGAVASARGEACVVWGYGQGEDFVGVGVVGLDETAFWEIDCGGGGG